MAKRKRKKKTPPAAFDGVTVGDRVRITQAGRFENESGTVLGFAGGVGSRKAIVLTCGWAPLVPLDLLQQEDDDGD